MPRGGDVEDAPERDAVVGVPHEPEVGEDVLHLPPLVEGHPADDLVGEVERAEDVLDRARLSVGAVQDRDVAGRGRLALAAQPLDLASDQLGLVVLVVCLEDDDVGAARAVGPQPLLLACRVVADDGVRGVEDPLGAAVVLLELHHRRVREVALEVEDVPQVSSTPGEDRLIVVADDGQVLLPTREVSQEHVLRAVRVLVLVDEDVLEAILPVVHRVIARLEQPHGEEEQVVEVERVVLAQEALVARPDDGRDPLQLAAGARGQVRGAAQLVLRVRDRGRDRARGDEPLPEPCVLHGLPQERALIGLVVDREARLDAHRARMTAEQTGAEGVEGTDRQLAQCGRGHEPLEALAHLPGSLVREGHGQDGARRDVQLAHQVGDPVRQDAGLA